MKQFLHAGNNYDTNAHSRACATHFPQPSLTQQHQAAETDINLIVKRYTATGMLPQSALEPLYGDFTQAVDFQEAQNKIRAAQEAFMLLPAELRSRFENDPAKLVAFVSDPANDDEAIKLKLRPPKPVEQPSVPAQGAPAPSGAGPAGPTGTPPQG